MFDNIDSCKKSILSRAQLKSSFFPRNHPDVKSNRRSEEEIMNEFIDSMETYQKLQVLVFLI